MLIAAGRDEDTVKREYRDEARQLSHVAIKLAMVFPPDRKRVSVKDWLDDWHFYAHMLFIPFSRLTKHRSRTRKGVAAKFISIALKQIGYAKATEAAVELALGKPPLAWPGVSELIARKAK